MSIVDVIEGRETWTVVKGDSRVVLADVSDNSLDSCVCDPPYGLGPREPTVDELVRYLQGEDTLQTGGDFMGRKWSVPSVGLWREVFRVLKPGAYLAAFSGTRTSALVEMGIRAAGFEVVDSLLWIFSSGFPKSADASKMIDKHFGAVREKVRPLAVPRGQREGTNALGGAWQDDPWETAPSTPEAHQWNGYGTALKPAHDRIILAMKPREGTIAANLLKHGCGAMNIGGCRVATDWSDRSEAWKASGHSAKPDADKIAAPPGAGITCHPSGRFPPDVIWSHAEGCNGTCVPGCPVRELGEQSGETQNGGQNASSDRRLGGCGIYGSFGPNSTPTQYAGDSGTAARFFPQFLHSSKASRTEREAGCEHLPPVTRTDITGREDDAAGQNNPRSGSRREGAIRNPHACVKPVSVLRWVTQLLTPPGGVVLDPFCGSGSGGCAAMAEGMRYVGIELDKDGFDYCAIARARIAWWQAHPGGPTPEAQEESRLEAAGQRSLFG